MEPSDYKPRQPERANLEDVLNYKPADYFSEDEIALVRNTFRDERVMHVLRKVFLPTMSDPALPVEQLGSDMWFADRNWSQIPNEELKSLVVARQDAIKFIMSGLVKLRIFAATKDETDIEASFRRSKDSTK